MTICNTKCVSMIMSLVLITTAPASSQELRAAPAEVWTDSVRIDYFSVECDTMHECVYISFSCDNVGRFEIVVPQIDDPDFAAWLASGANARLRFPGITISFLIWSGERGDANGLWEVLLRPEVDSFSYPSWLNSIHYPSEWSFLSPARSFTMPVDSDSSRELSTFIKECEKLTR